MKDIINKNIPCELFNLEKGEYFSLSPSGRKYCIVKINVGADYALCFYQIKDMASPAYCKLKLSKLVYPRDLERPLTIKRYDLFSPAQS